MRLKDQAIIGVVTVISATSIVMSRHLDNGQTEAVIRIVLLTSGMFGIFYVGAKLQQVTKFLDKNKEGK